MTPDNAIAGNAKTVAVDEAAVVADYEADVTVHAICAPIRCR